MNTIYETNISNNLTCAYIDSLINRVFALLPMFEESQVSDDKAKSFNIYQRNLIQTINANVTLIKYNSVLIVDILSHLQALFSISEHDDYKRHIFKICKLLTLLKNEVNKHGI